MLVEPLMMGRPKSSRPTRQTRETDVFVLTVRAYDLGVPVLFTTATIRIYPPESKTRTVTFVLPGRNIDRKKTEEILSTITGGRVIIHDIQPYNEDRPNNNGAGNGIDGSMAGINFGGGSNGREKSVVTATVLYDSNSVVDISQIQRRLQQYNSTSDISVRENADAEVNTNVWHTVDLRDAHFDSSHFHSTESLQGWKQSTILAADCVRAADSFDYIDTAVVLHLLVVPFVQGDEVSSLDCSVRNGLLNLNSELTNVDCMTTALLTVPISKLT